MVSHPAVHRLGVSARLLSTLAALMLSDVDELSDAGAEWDVIVLALGLPLGAYSGDVLTELRQLTRYAHGG